MRLRIREEVLGIPTRWIAVAGWLGLAALWLIWRAARESDFAVTHEVFPRYHLWFLFVTGVLVGAGAVLASFRARSDYAEWNRFVITVLVGTACLVLASFEIINMVHGCKFTYEGIFVP